MQLEATTIRSHRRQEETEEFESSKYITVQTPGKLILDRKIQEILILTQVKNIQCLCVVLISEQ